MATTLYGNWSAVMKDDKLVYTSKYGPSSYWVSGQVDLKNATLTVTNGATVSGITGSNVKVVINSGGALESSTMKMGTVTINSGGASINNAYYGTDTSAVYGGRIFAGGSSISDEFYATGTYNTAAGSAFIVDSGAVLSQPSFSSGSYVRIPNGAIVDGVSINRCVGVSILAGYGSAISERPPAPAYTQTQSGNWTAKMVNGQAALTSGATVLDLPIDGLRMTNGVLIVTSGVTVSGIYTDSVVVTINAGGVLEGSYITGSNVTVNSGGLSSSNVLYSPVNVKAGGTSNGDWFLQNNGPVFNNITGTVIDPLVGAANRVSWLWVNGTGKIVNPSISPNSQINVQGGVMDPSCFLAGAMILTDCGEIPVEALKAGDRIAVYETGEKTFVSVRAITSETVCVKKLCPPDEAGYPVRILAHAFSKGCPNRDLDVTAEHCFFLDGAFIPVRMLINGTTIAYVMDRARYDVYHVQCDTHHIIKANNVLTETHLDTASGEKSWEVHGAAPLNTRESFVAPIYNDLVARAVNLGHAAPQRGATQMMPQPPRIITRTGDVFSPVRKSGDRYIYRIRGQVDGSRLDAVCARPCDVTGPYVDDRRNLGVLVGEMTIFTGSETRMITCHLTEKRLSGWQPQEETFRRWTGPLALISCPEETECDLKVISIQVLDHGPGAFLAHRETSELDKAS